MIPAMLPIIPKFIDMAEGLFKGKQKSGPDKMATVLGMLRQVLERMKDSGALPKDAAQPGDSELTTLVEAVFQSGAPSAGAAPGRYFIVRGDVAEVKLP